MRRAPLPILLLLALLLPTLLSAAETTPESVEFDERGRRVLEPATPGTLAAALQELYLRLEEQLLSLEDAVDASPSHELRQSLRQRIVQEKDTAEIEALRIRLDFAQRQDRPELAAKIQAELTARLSPPDLVDPEAVRISAARTDRPSSEGGSR